VKQIDEDARKAAGFPPGQEGEKVAMKKFIITVLGQDRPGIIAAVSKVLLELDYNIEEVSQTILQDQFSCFFIVAGPERISSAQLVKALEEGVSFNLFFQVREFEKQAGLGRERACEPFVVTTRGPDRKGLVAGITAVFAAFEVNVAQLRAVFRGGDEPLNNTMIYEVDIPSSVDQKELRRALSERARELNLEISIQHRNIFEAMNRIL